MTCPKDNQETMKTVEDLELEDTVPEGIAPKNRETRLREAIAVIEALTSEKNEDWGQVHEVLRLVKSHANAEYGKFGEHEKPELTKDLLEHQVSRKDLFSYAKHALEELRTMEEGDRIEAALKTLLECKGLED